ncbi:hypothetical protein BVER_00215c [Candidatus Burkholderia verschuerenii]|uniref:Lipoprotein n=1 Tax=Candidatus Burkholderia verschuerenii TaxID=242163 RepID=A0A0L0MD01_9BURK|nr:hypothetical protein [Candidatus Burkholderia verschuerenii]KND60223.1 hypothetical protein BVER_00215c [Candidatus Burkholderia verschuerenii]
MNRWSIFRQWHDARAAGVVAAALVLGACAPLPQQNADTDAAAAASAASAAQVAKAAPFKPAPGEQRIVVGSSGGFHRTVKATAPSQVCDYDAFADGVRYGYALTWNRLVSEDARNAGGKSAKRKFDASAVHSQDDQYKIQWDGKERTNACASDGYLIGRVVGTHMAGVDMDGVKPAS